MGIHQTSGTDSRSLPRAPLFHCLLSFPALSQEAPPSNGSEILLAAPSLTHRIQFISKCDQRYPSNGTRERTLLALLLPGRSHHRVASDYSVASSWICAVPLSDCSPQSSQHSPLKTQVILVPPLPQTSHGCHLIQSEGNEAPSLLGPTSHHAVPYSLWDTQGSGLGFVHAKHPLTPGPLLFFPVSGRFFSQSHVIHTLFSLTFAQGSASPYVFP